VMKATFPCNFMASPRVVPLVAAAVSAATLCHAN
jgi:hypothetical protein